MSRNNQPQHALSLNDDASSSSQQQRKRQRQRRTVLSEEEYSDKLSTIIQRDYYPDLVELERQTAVNQRREAGDLAGAIAVRRAARQLQQHEESMIAQERREEEEALLLTASAVVPAQQQGVVNHRGGLGGLGLRRSPRPLERESLTGFHARVTSEDNAAFEETQQQEVEARRQARESMYGSLSLTATDGSSGRTFTATQSRSAEAVASPFLQASDEFLPESNAPDYFHNNSKNNNFSDDNLNALMPPPSNIDRKQKIPKDALVEYIPKATALQRKIDPSATRFPRRDIVIRRPQESHFEGSEDGSESSAEDYSTDGSTDLDAPAQHTIGQEQRQGLKRRRREQETLVQMTPLIVPGQQGNASPLVTWGAVGGTPVVLGQSQLNDDDIEPPRSSFCMPDRNSREKAAAMALGHLEERARKSRSTGTPILDRNKVSLTPAAKAFLAKNSSRSTVRPLSARSGSAFASALRSSYSRTPNSSRRSATSSSIRQKGRGRDRSSQAATPRMKSEAKAAPSIRRPPTNPNVTNVTDGLLQLPR
jgi:hypothetical protein